MTRFNFNTISKLIKCTYCNSSVNDSSLFKDQIGNNWGFIQCDCDVYPVVCDVIYLKKNTGMRNKKAVNLIRENKLFFASVLLIDDSRIIKYLLGFLVKYGLSQQRFSKLLSFLSKYLSRHKSWINYLSKRSNTSRDYLLLKSVLNKKIKKDDVIVDVGCGNAFNSRRLPVETVYIGLDHEFSTLLKASLFSKNKGSKFLICSDANHGLPLKNKIANHVVFLDSLGNIYKKLYVLEETLRISKLGFIYLIGMYHSDQTTDQWGYGLSVQKLLKPFKGRLLTASIFSEGSNFNYYSLLLKKNK